MKTIATTLTLALTILATAPAYAGGVDIRVKTANQYTQDAKGIVTLKVVIQRGDIDCAHSTRHLLHARGSLLRGLTEAVADPADLFHAADHLLDRARHLVDLAGEHG